MPKSTTELRLVQTGQTVRLTFPVTEPDVVAVDIYKQCNPQTEWPKDIEAFRRVELTSLPKETGSPGTYIFEDTIEQTTCRYAIRFVNEKRASDLSNTVTSSLQPVPASPRNLRADVQKNRIVLTWDPPVTDISGATPVNIAGYLVNGQSKTSEPRFEDPNFKFGEERRYAVQAIGREQDPLALSVPSEPLVVRPEDKFGPDPPANLAALSTGGKVQLVWESSPDADLKGYVVYRGTDPGALQKLADAPTNSFTDQNLPVGTTYHYAVSGVDTTGNEGPKSEPIAVVVNQ